MRSVAILFGLLLATVPALAQDSRCADCHLTSTDAPHPAHVEAWASSPHRNTGCEKCHGGNGGTLNPLRAHVGVLGSGNRLSPTHRRNLPTTCGACHVSQFVAFQDSRHYQLLQTGRENGPTCSTCHGEVDGRLLSPKDLASQCNECHGPRETAPRADRARQVRQQYEALSVVRQELKLADSLIKKVEERDRRTRLRESYDLIQTPVTRAIAAGHKFVYDDMKEYLATAQERVQRLLTSLVNR